MSMPRHSSGRTLVSAPMFARTDGYFAPELIGRRVSPKSDIYSFGVVSFYVAILAIYHLDKHSNYITGHSGNFHWDEGICLRQS